MPKPPNSAFLEKESQCCIHGAGVISFEGCSTAFGGPARASRPVLAKASRRQGGVRARRGLNRDPIAVALNNQVGRRTATLRTTWFGEYGRQQIAGRPNRP